MKTSFKMTFDDVGNPKFLDTVDKAAFSSLLSTIRKSFTDQGKKPIFEISVSITEKSTTEKQIGLWISLTRLIADNSGHSQSEVEGTILNNFSTTNEIPETMSNSRFQELLLYATALANEFFEVNIELSPEEQFIIKNQR